MNPGSSYTPGREIARGGMGAVLDVRDQKLGRSVAMKVMLRRNASEEEQQRFLQEARVLGQLAHPNIVPVHDVGTDEQGRLFYTMKLVQGLTLHDVIGKLKAGDKETLAKYPLNALLTIFQKVCDAIAFAHSRGIIHRDLKPQNIMVGEFGEVLVMDWGLAKLLPGSAAAEEAAKTLPLRGQLGQTGPTGTLPLGGRAALPRGSDDPQVVPTEVEEQATMVAGSAAAESDATVVAGAGVAAAAPKLNFAAAEPTASSGVYATMEGAVMGTPNFMSPEQAEGKIAELDARSDIFSLGGILYALLTLRPPVEGESLEEILSKVRSGTIAPPTAFNAPSSTTQAKASATGTVTEPRKIHPLPHCPDGKVPSALSAVTMKALTRDKLRRYQTVSEFTQDIAAYQGGFATRAENASALTLVRLFIHRHKALCGSAAVAIVIVAVVAVVAFQRVASERNVAVGERDRADNERKTANEQRRRAETALASLKKTAPTFFALSKTLVEQGNLEDALEKIGFAVSLDERNADYLVQQGNLFQATQKLTEAAAAYRAVLALRADAAAKLNLELCEKLLRDNAGRAELKRESLGELVTAMVKQGRHVEAAPLSAILGEGSDTARAAIIARLKPIQAILGLPGAGLSRLPDGSFGFSLRNNARVVELPPLNGLAITELNLQLTKISDLTPLKGLRLKRLDIGGSLVSDLGPLTGMPLEFLNTGQTKVSDLTPLKGMPLLELQLAEARSVADLSPLRGMALKKLHIGSTSVADLRPLAGMPIEELITGGYVSDLSPLAGMPLKVLNVSVSKVTDLSPLRGLPLRYLTISRTSVSDLSPLAGMPIEELHFWQAKVTDISVLRTLPLKRLIVQCPASALAPLADCKGLERLILPRTTADISFLRALPNLKWLSYDWPTSDSMEVMTSAAQFWQQYDAQKAAPK